ncbi:hypothetical protein OG897_08890 [Streptomyces sp. NBC_00237]|uniref:hypothetical protein n=1 Tax=Streptomyces sp. NBC_00237 TaxID=2975687 RepID=UPI0022501B95|nr:hypothetical protein [Streptomyces sp. NBC_00237]MCX5201564.1 hypothetical protein [Streptomyces sp. NBC_00237]
MKKVVRGLAYAAVPGELALAGCLLAGVRVPGRLLLVAEALVVLVVLAEVLLFVRLRRRGLTGREAVAELVPEPVRRMLGHELRVLASLGRWVARRRHGVGPGDVAFGHAKAQAALLYGFTFVCVVETVGLHVLLAALPVVQKVFLVVDVYTVVLVLGLHAAAVTRPHVVREDGGLRVRSGAHVDVTIPAGRIASVRYDLRLNPGQAGDDALELAVASQTSVTVRLNEPVEAVSLLGKRRPVTVVHFHADDARGLVAAWRERGGADPAPSVTRAGTGPSPSRGLPASA